MGTRSDRSAAALESGVWIWSRGRGGGDDERKRSCVCGGCSVAPFGTESVPARWERRHRERPSLEEVERKGGNQARVLLRREKVDPNVGTRRIVRSIDGLRSRE
jgi:hypothetical protein